MKFYDASHQLTPEKRWIRIQNDFFYKPQTLPTLLRSIFEEAKKDNESPKFSVVKEEVKKVEPRIRVKKEKVIKEKVIKEKKERIKKTVEEIKAKRREHYELNHERLLQQKRDYHKANAEKIIAQKRQYRIDHADEISQKKKEYYKKRKLEKELLNKIEIDSGSLVIEDNK